MVRTGIEGSYRCFKVQLMVHTQTGSGIQNTFIGVSCTTVLYGTVKWKVGGAI